MAKKKNKWLYRALCAALAVTLVSGTAVMSPIADIIGTNIVAEATSSSNVCNNLKGQYLDSGTTISTNGRVYTTTIYLDNSIVLNQSNADYITPSRVYVGTNSTQSSNNYIIYLTTAKLDQSPTISAESKTYDGNAVSYDTGTGYGTCTVNFTGINDTSYDSSTAPSEAGDYRMTVSYAGDGNYKSWSGTADFTISKATPVMYEGYTEWTGEGTDAEGNSTTVTCYWKVDENGKLFIAGTIPDTNGKTSNIPWYGYKSNITEITTEEGAKTSADARYLFREMTKVTTMDLSNLDTSATTRIDYMFMYCMSLTSLDLSGWNTSNFSRMGSTFNNCTSLTSLDLGGWSTSEVTDMYGMFYNCKNLKTIIVGNGWNTDKVEVNDSSSMFDQCTSLVGGNGTTFDSNYVDKTYARIDGENGQKGYFTQGTAPAKTYTVTWKNYDGTTLETDENVEEGTTPSYDGATPEKTATAQYSYTFSGWDNEPTAVTGNATYTAQFTETTNTYTVTWVDGDGNTLTTDTVAYGETPVYSGATPIKIQDDEYAYTFSGWTDSIKTYEPNNTLPAVKSDVTYTATFVSGIKSIVNDRYYYVDDQLVKGFGMIKYQGDYYYVKKNGAVLRDMLLNVTADKTNGLVPAGKYKFDEDGKMVMKNGIIVGDCYYADGKLAKGAGLVEVDGDYYYVRANGAIYKNVSLNVTEEKTNGLVAAGKYKFDADGKMVINGIVDGYYYADGKPAKGVGLIESNGNYYYIKANGAVYKNASLNVTEDKANGLVPAGKYFFDSEGKMIIA